MDCSVVIPTKDRPKSLSVAVQSALAALPEKGEVLVVDDGGTFPAAETLSGLACDRLKVLVNPGPRGPSQARNFGVQKARGATIFFLDDDDELLPDYCMRVLARPRTARCAFGHCAPLHMEIDGPPSYHGRNQATGEYGSECALELRLAGLGMGFWIEREVFVRSGGIDSRLKVNEDTEFSIRLAAIGYRSFYDSQAGVLLRHDHTRHGGDQPSITKSASAIERAKGFEYILSKHQDYLRLYPRFRRLFLSRVLKYRSRSKDLDGFAEFVRSIKPITDRVLMLSVGNVALRLSISVRVIQDKAKRAA